MALHIRFLTDTEELQKAHVQRTYSWHLGPSQPKAAVRIPECGGKNAIKSQDGPIVSSGCCKMLDRTQYSYNMDSWCYC